MISHQLRSYFFPQYYGKVVMGSDKRLLGHSKIWISHIHTHRSPGFVVITMISMEKYLVLGGLGFTMRVFLERSSGYVSIVALKPHKGYTMLGFIRKNITATWSTKMDLTNFI
ncbi:hypothetical protein K435DRAFT_779727 [Dendrothele bispora CBS 962.96]|uniref:Uncharacterized protein n=1 Tax=Dendrothele bispora (strain CBS 962.96) TaxID=1314807 RepID=A0A4S8LX09_DENBC|nr:hypothetical protein K435DRAFT_779727 [Dendrothele bispora CBS 962.96]